MIRLFPFFPAAFFFCQVFLYLLPFKDAGSFHIESSLCVSFLLFPMIFFARFQSVPVFFDFLFLCQNNITDGAKHTHTEGGGVGAVPP